MFAVSGVTATPPNPGRNSWAGCGRWQPPQNGGDGDNEDDRPRLGLVQPLLSTLARLPPPGGGVPAEDPNLRFTLSLACVYKSNKMFIQSSCLVCTLFT